MYCRTDKSVLYSRTWLRKPIYLAQQLNFMMLQMFNSFSQVLPKMVYCGTLSLVRNTFSRFGVEYTCVDGSDPEKYRQAIKPNTKVCSHVIFTFQRSSTPMRQILWIIWIYISNRPQFLWVYRRDKPRGMLGEDEKSL